MINSGKKSNVSFSYSDLKLAKMTTVQEQDIYTSNLYVKFIFFIRQFGLVNNNAFLTMTLSLPK